MENSNIRVCIYPKDVQKITGKSYKQSTIYLQKLRAGLNKKPHQLVSISEFSEYYGLRIEDVIKCIKG